MWCPHRQTFANQSKGAAFAALRWHELFSGQTPDLFHPSLFNLTGLLKEAQFIGELIPRHDAWKKQLFFVREEIGSRKLSLEARVLTQRQKQMLDRICDNQVSPQEATGLARLLLLEDLETQINDQLANDLRNLNFSLIGEKKSQGDDILRHAATVAYRKGGVLLEEQSIRSAIAGGDEGVRKLLDLGGLLQPGEFDCVVGIMGLDENQLNELRKVCDHREATDAARIYKAGTHLQGLPTDVECGWLSGKVKAENATMAVEQFKERIRNGMNVMALFYQRPAKALHPSGWIIVQGNAREVPSRDTVLRNHNARGRALDLADTAMKNLAGVVEPSIFAALDLHNAALSTADHRFRLVNLWSALECLTAVLEGDSIINRVLRVAPPLLAWRNIDKLTRYLGISLHHWIKGNPDLDTATLPFSLGYNKNVPPERLLKVLTQPQGSSSMVKLLAFTSDHPLLVFRMTKAWKQFTSPKAVRLGMDQSQQRIRWHLYRIYRARNLLIHQGIAVDCMPQMADHLQHYVSWLIGRMVQALGFSREWKLRDAWNYWGVKADYVIQSLPTREGESTHLGLVMEDVFTGKLLGAQLPIWQQATQPEAPSAQ